MERLPIYLLAAFVITLILLVSYSSYLSNEYPDLSSQDSLNNTIAHITKDGRASLVIFNNQKKCTLPWAKINQDGKELNLTSIVKVGDVLIKKEFSDTIILVQGTRKYTFVAYTTIK